MKIYLKRFSQEVNISNPESVQYFMVFEIEGSNKGEIKLPVPKETNEALIKELYAESVESAPIQTEPEPSPLEEEDADVWDGEDSEPPTPQSMYYLNKDVPEDEIPSI